MIFLTFDIEKLTTQQIQNLGEKWLERLSGMEKKVGKTYLYAPSRNKTKRLYGTNESGRAGVIGIFLEIIANVLIQEEKQAQQLERKNARKERRTAEVIQINNHYISQDAYETYRPFKLA
jgi:hypothetical protein